MHLRDAIGPVNQHAARGDIALISEGDEDRTVILSVEVEVLSDLMWARWVVTADGRMASGS